VLGFVVVPPHRKRIWKPQSALEIWWLQYLYWTEEMRRRFPSVDNRPESELTEEARLIFNSQLDAITEIGTVLFFGSKTFLTRRAMEEQRSIHAGVPLPRDVIGERAYFVDCLNDKSAAFAKRWERRRTFR